MVPHILFKNMYIIQSTEVLTHPKTNLINKRLFFFSVFPKCISYQIYVQFIFYTAEKYASKFFAFYDVITRKNANLYVHCTG